MDYERQNKYQKLQKTKFKLTFLTKSDRMNLGGFLTNSENVITGKEDARIGRLVLKHQPIKYEDIETIEARLDELYEDSSEFSQDNGYSGHGGELDSETLFHYQKVLETVRDKIFKFRDKMERK